MKLDEHTLAQRWGLKIAELRSDQNISQVDLAAAAGTTQQTISRIERGEQVPSDGMRVRLARALDVYVTELFRYDDHEEVER